MKQNWKQRACSLVACGAMLMGMLTTTGYIHAEGETTKTVTDATELQDALDNSSVNTIVLGADITKDVVIPTGKALTLDLATYTLTNASNDTITNNGNLTITGSGKVDNVTHQKAAILNNGTAVLNGGTYERSKEAGKSDTSGGGNSWYTILNKGTMEIKEPSHIILDGVYSSALNNLGTAAKLTINGGTFDGGKYTLKNDDYGTMVVNGGTFNNYSPVGASILNWHDLTVNGGTFTTTNVSVANGYGGSTDIGKVVINGGIFTGAKENGIIYEFPQYLGGTISISAGVFSQDPGKYVVSGYKAYLVDGAYTVGETVSDIKLNVSDVTLQVGKIEHLQATVTPAIAKGEVTWTSSDPTIVKVENEGSIQALKPGKATITAKVGSLEAKCTVTVYDVEANVPTVDPTKPVEKVEAGINDAKAEETITATVNQVVADVLAGKDTTMVDKETAVKIKDAATAGKAITTETVAEKVDPSNVVKADAEKASDLLETLVTKDTNTMAIAQYLDLRVVVKVDGTEVGSVKELTSPITYTVVLPKDLLAENREFFVIRVHEGKAEKLPATVKDNVLTFSTDKFSTYALAYEDKKEETTVTPEVKTHKVTFVDWKGNVLAIQNVEEGKNATAPTAPEVKGYHFVKWDSDFTNVKGDLVVKAVYEKDSTATTPTDNGKKPSDKTSGTKKPGSKNDNSVNTGDTTNSGLYAGFAMLALVSMGIVVVLRKKQSLHK